MDGTPSVESVFVEPVGPSQSIRSQCEKNEAERGQAEIRQTQKSQTEVPKTEKYKSNFQVGVRSLRLGPRAAHLLFGGVFGSVMVIATYTVADKSSQRWEDIAIGVVQETLKVTKKEPGDTPKKPADSSATAVACPDPASVCMGCLPMPTQYTECVVPKQTYCRSIKHSSPTIAEIKEGGCKTATR
jgi:hypothetical protein